MNKAIKQFADYYLPNKIFFTETLSLKMDKLLNEYWKNGSKFSQMNNAFKKRDLPNEMFREYIDKTREISEKVEKEFPALINELETEFRKILGV